MQKLDNPHGAFFKQSMRHPAIVKDWFRSHVPEPLWKQLNPNSLCLMDKKAFFSPHDQQLRSDLVYRVEATGGVRPICCLVEHQSRPDPLMARRLAERSLAGTRQYKDKKVRYVPLFLLFCFYHGKVSPYPFGHQSTDCFPEEYREFVKRMAYTEVYFVDLSVLTSEPLHKDGLASFFQHLLKCHREPNHVDFLRKAQLRSVVEALFERFEEDEGYVKDWAIYLLRGLGQHDADRLDELITLLDEEFLPRKIKGNMRNFAQRFEQ